MAIGSRGMVGRAATERLHERSTPGRSGLQRLASASSVVVQHRAVQALASEAADFQPAAALQRRIDGSVPLQAAMPEEEELLQGRFSAPVQREAAAGAATATTALPSALRGGLESLSGTDLGDVRVHYGSAQPARVGALAYAQGRDIHVAPGEERHLPHEAWHTVQQRQGRVPATGTIDGVPLNADPALEREADTMGRRASEAAQRRRRD